MEISSRSSFSFCRLSVSQPKHEHDLKIVYLFAFQLPLQRLLPRMQATEAIDAFLILLADFFLFADFCFFFTRELICISIRFRIEGMNISSLPYDGRTF